MIVVTDRVLNPRVLIHHTVKCLRENRDDVVAVSALRALRLFCVSALRLLLCSLVPRRSSLGQRGGRPRILDGLSSRNSRAPDWSLWSAALLLTGNFGCSSQPAACSALAVVVSIHSALRRCAVDRVQHERFRCVDCNVAVGWGKSLALATKLAEEVPLAQFAGEGDGETSESLWRPV